MYMANCNFGFTLVVTGDCFKLRVQSAVQPYLDSPNLDSLLADVVNGLIHVCGNVMLSSTLSSQHMPNIETNGIVHTAYSRNPLPRPPPPLPNKRLYTYQTQLTCPNSQALAG